MHLVHSPPPLRCMLKDRLICLKKTWPSCEHVLTATDQAAGLILQGLRFEFGNCFCPSQASSRLTQTTEIPKIYEIHRDGFRPEADPLDYA